MKKIYLASVWAPGAIPPEEWKYHNLKRVMFPVIDLLFFFAGLNAILYGIPEIDEFFTDIDVTFFSYIMCAAAITCLLGVSFPKLWPLEMVGKSVLLGLMVGFISALAILGVSGEPSRMFALFISLIAICQVVWRVTLLGAEWQDRKLTYKIKIALLKAQAEKESNSG